MQANEIIEDLNQKLYPDQIKFKPFYKPVIHRKVFVQQSNCKLKASPKNYVRENYRNMTQNKNYVSYDIHNRRSSYSSIFNDNDERKTTFNEKSHSCQASNDDLRNINFQN